MNGSQLRASCEAQIFKHTYVCECVSVWVCAVCVCGTCHSRQVTGGGLALFYTSFLHLFPRYFLLSCCRCKLPLPLPLTHKGIYLFVWLHGNYLHASIFAATTHTMCMCMYSVEFLQNSCVFCLQYFRCGCSCCLSFNCGKHNFYLLILTFILFTSFFVIRFSFAVCCF